ncbi:PadR family transcriptional regulator [Candidatus Izimaplasma bacterium]|nr:PadR family transcriptional regulator [Candidatus Izimaplasma bacterium]
MAKLTSDLIRGHTDTMVLKLLQERDMYGYELVKEIYVRSNKQYELKEVTLYASLRRLVLEKCVESYWGDESKGGRRKYYKITKIGMELYQKNRGDWNYSKTILDKLL